MLTHGIAPTHYNILQQVLHIPTKPVTCINSISTQQFLCLGAAVLALSTLMSCGLPCPPKNDPHFVQGTALSKTNPASISGVYTDSWTDWPGMYRESWELRADGAGEYVSRIDWVNEPEPYINPVPLKWNTAPDGSILVQLTGTNAAALCNRGRYSMRWTTDGLHNMTTGRMLPRFGTPIHHAKLQQSSIRHTSNSEFDAAITSTLEGMIMGASTAMAANQASSDASRPGGAGSIAGAATSGSGNLGIWTALGNGTWLYNDGTITGTVNNQGFFYGTNSKSGKVTLRNPGTFTPGTGTLR